VLSSFEPFSCLSEAPAQISFRRLSDFFQSTAWPPYLVVGVEQPFGQNHQAMFIGQNHQAVQSMGRSMVWTFEDNKIDGLFSVSHPQAAEGATPHLCKQERRRLS